jgi:nucleoside-diphosphate kinase
MLPIPLSRRRRDRDEPAHPPAIGLDSATIHQSTTAAKVDLVTDRTLVLVKPDGVQRLLAGRIIGRFEERGLKIVGLKLVSVDRDLAERHYAIHRERPFFRGLVDFITSSPLVAMVLEGPNAVAVVRAMVGATRPHEAAPGTIRGDYALETAQNLVHASDGPETAVTEIALWFAADELVSYEREIDRWALAPAE